MNWQMYTKFLEEKTAREMQTVFIFYNWEIGATKSYNGVGDHLYFLRPTHGVHFER